MSRLHASMLRYVSEHPAMRRLGRALDTVVGPPPGSGARRLAAMSDHILAAVLDDYHAYLAGVLAQIDDRLVPLLTDLHELRNGRRLPPERTPAVQRADLEELERAIDGMRDLGDHVREVLGGPDRPLARQLREELAGTLPPPPRRHHVEPDPFPGLSERDAPLVRLVDERHPRLLRDAVGAETDTGFERRLAELRAGLAGELSKPQLDELADVVTRLNQGRKRADPGYAGSMSEEADRARFDAAVAGIRQPGLRTAVAGNAYLARLAYESPRELREQWVRWRLDGERYEFWKWMFLQRNPVRGRHGEFQAAFALGRDFLLIKAPKFVTTARGTDLVALDRRTGRILLIDNKAWENPVVGQVDALTANLLANLGDDARHAHAAAGDGIPNDLDQVAARLAEAERELRHRLGDRLPDSPEGREITGRVLRERRIDLVVTGEGGRVADLTDALKAFGVELLHLSGGDGN